MTLKGTRRDRRPVAYQRVVSLLLSALTFGFVLTVNRAVSDEPSAAGTLVALATATVVSLVLARAVFGSSTEERPTSTVRGAIAGSLLACLLVVVGFYFFWLVIAPATGYVPN